MCMGLLSLEEDGNEFMQSSMLRLTRKESFKPKSAWKSLSLRLSGKKSKLKLVHLLRAYFLLKLTLRPLSLRHLPKHGGLKPP